MDTQDIKLYYKKYGHGPALILLHGNGEDGTYFCNQISELSEYFTLYIVDTRGHGKSPRGTADFTLKQFSEDLKHFMDDIGLKKAAILGFSDGGNIALLFAISYPYMVDSLILNSANLNPAGMKKLVTIGIKINNVISKLLSPFSSRAKIRCALNSLMLKEPDIDIEELKKLNMPVLVIAGDKDMIRSEETQKISDNIPDAKQVIIKGDHFIANKQSACFNAEVIKFLQNCNV